MNKSGSPKSWACDNATCVTIYNREVENDDGHILLYDREIW